MPEIGKISTLPIGTDVIVEWRISGFFSLDEKVGASYGSPHFPFGGETWYLRIRPNGSSTRVSSGHVDLELWREPFTSFWRDFTGPHFRQAFSLSLKTVKGEKACEKHYIENFKGGYSHHEFNHFIQRSQLSKRRSELVPNGALTVVCTMKNTTSAGSDSNTASVCAECCHCKGTFDTDSLSYHQRKCMERPIKCPDCLEVIALQTWLDEHDCQKEKTGGATSTAECAHCKLSLEAASMPTHEKSCIDKPMKCPQCGEVVSAKLWLNHECLTARTNAIEKLLRDLKRIMVCGDYSDMTVKVRGEEFRLHRNILGTRNSFFGSRFSNESQEPTPGTLSIDDCRPDEFRTLIHYIYTGTADNLCPENVSGLYEVAVKYQEQQMRAECLQFMMNTLSVDNFCDYIALALNHDQEELFQKATELFMSKVKEIIRHDKWKHFLEKYPTQANELYMKALDRDDEK